jgi:hypothetical protein
MDELTMDESNDNDRALTAALRGVAEDDARLGASASVEHRLRAVVRSIAARRRRTAIASAAIAAALLIALAVPAWRVAAGRMKIVPTHGGSGDFRPAVPGEVATAFLPLIYSGVPMTDGQVVRLVVPRAALASFGLAPFDTVDSGTVMADVIVGEDGLARAVRFVRPARRAAQEQKP